MYYIIHDCIDKRIILNNSGEHFYRCIYLFRQVIYYITIMIAITNMINVYLICNHICVYVAYGDVGTVYDAKYKYNICVCVGVHIY